MKILPVTSPTAIVSSTGWHAIAVKRSLPALVKIVLQDDNNDCVVQLSTTNNANFPLTIYLPVLCEPTLSQTNYDFE